MSETDSEFMEKVGGHCVIFITDSKIRRKDIFCIIDSLGDLRFRSHLKAGIPSVNRRDAAELGGICGRYRR